MSMLIAPEFRQELFLLIGRLHTESTAKESGVIRKASELYALCLNLQPLRGDSIAFRRNRLGLDQSSLAALCHISDDRLAGFEQEGGPAWLGPILDVLEERRRDLDSPAWGR